MPTLIEMPEPEVLDQTEAANGCACQPQIGRQSMPPAAFSAAPLFSGSLLESSSAGD